MANWCTVNVEIDAADPLLVAQVVALLNETDRDDADPFDLGGYFSLERIDPTPTNLPDGTVTDWRTRHWGTKWDTGAESPPEASLAPGAAYARWSFDTAWSPPLAALDTLAARYPDLHIACDYEEGGNDFAGEAEWRTGVRVHEYEGPAQTTWCEQCGNYATTSWDERAELDAWMNENPGIPRLCDNCRAKVDPAAVVAP